MGDILRLVEPIVSEDTVLALEVLLAEAKAGRLIGLAYAGLYPAKEYVVDVAGGAKSEPLRAHSLVALLAHELIRIHRADRY